MFFAVEEVVRAGLNATKTQLTISLTKIKKHIGLLIKLLMKCDQSESAGYFPCNTKREYTTRVLILYRQCERFIIDLLNTVIDSHKIVERFLRSFRHCLNDIHEIVKFRTAVPIENIFVSYYF